MKHQKSIRTGLFAALLISIQALSANAGEPPRFTTDHISEFAIITHGYYGNLTQLVEEPDGDELTFSLLSGAPEIYVHHSGIIGADDAGTHHGIIQVADKDGTDTLSVEIDILDIGMHIPLSYNFFVLKSTDESGHAYVALNAHADYRATYDYYTWEENGVLLGEGKTAYVTLPAGKHILEIKAYENGTLMETAVAHADIQAHVPVNQPIDAGTDQIVQTPAGTKAPVTLSFTGGENLVDAYWVEANLIIGNGRTARVNLPIGMHTLVATAKDVNGHIQKDYTTVEVVEGEPQLDVFSGIDQEIEADASGFASVELNADGTGDIVDYVWKKDGARIGNGADLSLELPVGEHTFICRVKDTLGQVVRDDVKITVTPWVRTTNARPYFTLNPIIRENLRAKKTFKRDISNTVLDPDNDPVTFYFVSGPSWLSVSKDGVIEGRPTKADKGRNVFIIGVKDDFGGSDKARVLIRVK